MTSIHIDRERPRTFQEAASRLLDLVNSYMNGKMLLLGKIADDTFSIVKLQNHGTACELEEGQSVPLEATLCKMVFASRKPVVIADTHAHETAKCLQVVHAANIGSYLGVPVFKQSGEVFGTLCALDSTTTPFTEEDVRTFEGLAEFFSYVLELEGLANYDSLTGLYNRHFLYSYFDRGERKNREGAILFLDLDGFKQVNDKLGHEVGDMLLREVASRIRKLLRAHDVPVRLGGDEFVIDLVDVSKYADIEQKAKELLHHMRDWPLFGHELQLSTSIGIALYPQDGEDIRKLLKYADIALYVSKEKGKNNYKFFDNAK